ncbi:tetratricopeptide repeat protein [Alphaproteobacteria bacterium]|nr:tetratricopeptide repeat protein [Alphaproteobacteria bacterium]
MSAYLNVNEAIIKAKLHAKKGEIGEINKLYQSVLKTFPKNKIALQKLLNLEKISELNNKKTIPLHLFNELINLYSKHKFSDVVEKANYLLKKYPDAFLIWDLLGVSLAQLGMLNDAVVALKKVLSLNPNYAETYCNLANILKNQGKLDKAIEYYKKSISLKPNLVIPYCNMGVILHEQKKFSEAEKLYLEAISIQPEYADAYTNLGNLYNEDGRLEEAIDAYKKSILYNPNDADAYNNLGNVFKHQGNLEAAIDLYKKSINLNPKFVKGYNNMGVALYEQGKIEDALKAYNKSINLNPKFVKGYNNIGIILHEKGKLDEAIKVFQKSIALKPDDYEVYNYIGNTYQDQGKIEKAIKAYNKSISINPSYEYAYNNMGIAFKYKGKVNNAISAYKKAISIKPKFVEAHLNLSFALLNIGEFYEGIYEYEWRWKTVKGKLTQRHFSVPLWDGKKSLIGKRILVWSEQGVGDTINWSLFLSSITSTVEHCILECQHKLVPLLKNSFPNIEVSTENRSLDTIRDDIDFHLPMGSLCKHFFNSIKYKSKISPHLVPDPTRVNFWKKQLNTLGKGPYIGICWKSLKTSPNRLQNNSNILQWKSILRTPNIKFINLQPKSFEDDIKKIHSEIGVTVHNFNDLDHFNDLYDVSALISALDMVISTKTTVPLIAAGVGTKTKLANWRQSSWNNVLFNPMSTFVEFYERNTWEPWEKVFNSILEDILIEKKLGVLSE